jgi:hypothetical protein
VRYQERSCIKGKKELRNKKRNHQLWMEERFYHLILALMLFLWILSLVATYYYACSCPTCPTSMRSNMRSLSRGSYPPIYQQATGVTGTLTSRGNNLVSPGEWADLKSILFYLTQRKSFINGALYDPDIMKAITDPDNWTINNEVSPPTASYHGDTTSQYWLLWNQRAQKWDITTLSPYAPQRIR